MRAVRRAAVEGPYCVVGNEGQNGAERTPHALGVEPVTAPFALQRELGVRAIYGGAHAQSHAWPASVSAAAPVRRGHTRRPSYHRHSSSTCPPCSWYAPVASSPGHHRVRGPVSRLQPLV